MEKALHNEGIADNLRFMILEVTKQIENAKKVLDTPDPKLVESIESRDDYIDNLKSVIENSSFAAILRQGATEKRKVDLFRAVNTISSNLERIADFAVNIVSQTQYLVNPEFIQRYNYERFFAEILACIDLIYQAVIKQDISLAFRICRCEANLDLLYKVQFDRILQELRSGHNTENLITSHLIIRYLERMGDAMLNIGEAIIFAAVGEKFKINQYEALKETLAVSGVETPISDVEFKGIWGTRSGCRIGKVSPGQLKEESEHSDRIAAGVLFKEGNRKKLLQERGNIERWEALMPGLPPRILAYQEDGAQASMLVEFLGGCTFQDVVLSADLEILRNAFFMIGEIMETVWEQTKAFGPVRVGFIPQLRSRISDVFRLYPLLHKEHENFSGLGVFSIEELLDKAEAIEDELEAPYSVFIHGDCNINNILYDHVTQKIHYIDLHRSRQTDPLQDISVLLVSHFRLPVFDPELRNRLNQTALGVYHFAKSYATKNNDTCFMARLSLGLLRSFISSVRFELNPAFAKHMYLRGIYLLNKMLAHQGTPWEDFVLPENVIVY